MIKTGMESRIILGIGSGRCGTRSLADVLNRWAWPTLFQVPARVPYLALGTLVGATVVLNAVLGLWIGRTVGARAPLELLRED